LIKLFAYNPSASTIDIFHLYWR